VQGDSNIAEVFADESAALPEDIMGRIRLPVPGRRAVTGTDFEQLPDSTSPRRGRISRRAGLLGLGYVTVGLAMTG